MIKTLVRLNLWLSPSQLPRKLNMLQTPKKWPWATKEWTSQYAYNHQRMQYLLQHELQTVVNHCLNCSTTGFLLSLDQINPPYCVDYVAEGHSRSEKLKTERTDTCNDVQPSTLS